MMATDEYFQRLHEVTSSNFLDGVSDQDIQDDIDLYTYVIYLDSLNSDFIDMQALHIELDKLNALMNARWNLKDGTIDINQFYGIYVQNDIYDQINMGTENFVKACFENLLKRSATAGELADGENMVDGVSATLFLQNGNSKGEFVDIMTHNDEFYQGLVIEYYKTLMLRNPTSDEIAVHAQELKTTGDYKALQKLLVTSKEYAGF
jgi:hypothetical protein